MKNSKKQTKPTHVAERLAVELSLYVRLRSVVAGIRTPNPAFEAGEKNYFKILMATNESYFVEKNDVF